MHFLLELELLRSRRTWFRVQIIVIGTSSFGFVPLPPEMLLTLVPFIAILQAIIVQGVAPTDQEYLLTRAATRSQALAAEWTRISSLGLVLLSGPLLGLRLQGPLPEGTASVLGASALSYLLIAGLDGLSNSLRSRIERYLAMGTVLVGSIPAAIGSPAARLAVIAIEAPLVAIYGALIRRRWGRADVEHFELPR